VTGHLGIRRHEGPHIRVREGPHIRLMKALTSDFMKALTSDSMNLTSDFIPIAHDIPLHCVVCGITERHGWQRLHEIW